MSYNINIQNQIISFINSYISKKDYLSESLIISKNSFSRELIESPVFENSICDCLFNFNHYEKFISENEKKYDSIVLETSYINDFLYRKNKINNNKNKRVEESSIILDSLKNLSEDGEIISINSSFIYRENGIKEIIKNNMVEQIINIPIGFFRGLNKTVVLIICKKNRNPEDKVLLSELEEKYIEISNKELLEKNIINPIFYLKNKENNEDQYTIFLNDFEKRLNEIKKDNPFSDVQLCMLSEQAQKICEQFEKEIKKSIKRNTPPMQKDND